MKVWMHKIHKTCFVPLIVLIVMITFLMIKGVESAYTIQLWKEEMEVNPTGEIVMLAYGGDMFRVNSFYVDGKRVKHCNVETINYNSCRITVDSSVFYEGNAWYELRVGYNKWGFINLLSSPIWVEWTGS